MLPDLPVRNPEHPLDVVVTGCGSVSAAGNTSQLHDAVRQQRVCLTELAEPPYAGCPARMAGRAPDLPATAFPRALRPFISRHTLLAAAAAEECLQHARLGDRPPERTGLLFGSSCLGQDQIQRAAAALTHGVFATLDSNLTATATDAGACHHLATRFALSGMVHVVEAASASGLAILHTASRMIRTGECERVLCVTSEAPLFPGSCLFYAKRGRAGGVTHSFFGRQHDPEPRSAATYVKPFGPPAISERGAIAEAGAALCLESRAAAAQRAAPVLGELTGSAFAFHAETYRGGDPTARGLHTVLDGLEGAAPDAAFLAVTGCYGLDVQLCHALGARYPGLPVCTAEPLIGHTGAASSLVNCILALHALATGVIPATRNYRPEDSWPKLRLRPLVTPLAGPPQHILVPATGWGGYNAACLFSNPR